MRQIHGVVKLAELTGRQSKLNQRLKQIDLVLQSAPRAARWIPELVAERTRLAAELKDIAEQLRQLTPHLVKNLPPTRPGSSRK